MNKDSKLNEKNLSKLILVSVLILAFSSVIIPTINKNFKRDTRQKSIIRPIQSIPKRFYRHGGYRKKHRHQYKNQRYFDNSTQLYEPLYKEYKRISQFIHFYSDEGYLDYSIGQIIKNKGFEREFEDLLITLQKEYFEKINSQETVNWGNVNSMYEDYIYNNISKNDNEIKFFDKITEVKKIYYEFFTSNLKFKKITISKILKSNAVSKIFGKNGLKDYLNLYFSENKSLSFIDNKIKELSNKRELTLNEEKFLGDIQKIKIMFNFYLKQNKKLTDMKKRFTSFGKIMNDKDFIKFIDLERMENFAKNLLQIGQKTKIRWADLDKLVKNYKQSILKFKKLNIPHDKYKILKHLSETNEEYYEYKYNNITPLKSKTRSSFCNKECVKTCKNNFKAISEFLSCTHIACLCRDSDLIDLELVPKESNSSLIMFIVISLFAFSILLFTVNSIRNKKTKNNQNYEKIPEIQEYELMKVDEMEETLISKID